MLLENENNCIVLCPSALIYDLLNNRLNVGTRGWASIRRAPLPFFAPCSPQIGRIPIHYRSCACPRIYIVGIGSKGPRISGKFTPNLMLRFVGAVGIYEDAHPC